MLSLIGSTLGLFSSAIPKAMEMWQDKNDKAHELALLKAQTEITLDQTAIDASIREVESVHQQRQQYQRLDLGGKYQSVGSADHGVFIYGFILRRRSNGFFDIGRR